jgi:hypothetical protein
MVRTSLSASLGVGPRLQMRCSFSQSSVRQKTAVIKVLRSTSGGLLYIIDRF